MSFYDVERVEDVCRNCGLAVILPAGRFCPDCGWPRPRPPAGTPMVDDTGEISCPACWAPNPPTNRHCEHCAARLGLRGAGALTPSGASSVPPIALYAALVVVSVIVVVAFNAFTSGLTPPDDTGDPAPTVGSSRPPVSAPAETSPTSIRVVGPLAPATVSASTELSAEFGVDNLTDGDPDSAWNDASLHGVGSTLTFDFGREVIIDDVVITNLSNDERYTRNYRVREYSIELDGLDATIAGELADVSDAQTVAVDGRTATILTLRVVSTYPASEYQGAPPFEELAIAEISFTGR